MYPELFRIGPITIYTYGVLLAVSYLLGLWLAMRRAQMGARRRIASSTSASTSSSQR